MLYVSITLYTIKVQRRFIKKESTLLLLLAEKEFLRDTVGPAMDATNVGPLHHV